MNARTIYSSSHMVPFERNATFGSPDHWSYIVNTHCSGRLPPATICAICCMQTTAAISHRTRTSHTTLYKGRETHTPSLSDMKRTPLQHWRIHSHNDQMQSTTTTAKGDSQGLPQPHLSIAGFQAAIPPCRLARSLCKFLSFDPSRAQRSEGGVSGMVEGLVLTLIPLKSRTYESQKCSIGTTIRRIHVQRIWQHLITCHPKTAAEVESTQGIACMKYATGH